MGHADFVIGAFYGDEGKGAVADRLVASGDYKAVVRFQGGNNAGHTLVLGEETYKLHLIPCGIVVPGTMAVIGNGCVVDPFILKEEIEMLENRGIPVENLRVSDLAHVIGPYHRAQDYIQEARRSVDEKIGSTCRGISPAYSDKINRRGIRIGDLLNANTIRTKVQKVLVESGLQEEIKMALEELEFDDYSRQFLQDSLDTESVINDFLKMGQELKHFITDTANLLWETLETGDILLEGAQGIFLDIDFGSYPFVTSSSIVAGAGNSGAGIPQNRVRHVFGVLKAFGTRIDTVGPFPTWERSEIAEGLIDKGGEFGTTTGRRRRFGWIDLVAGRYAKNLTGIDRLAVTKIDTLTGLEEIPVCIGYKIDGEITTRYPSDIERLRRAEPVYQILPGWSRDVSNARSFSDLPVEAQNYINIISEFLDVPVFQVGVGPGRDQVISINPG